VAAAVLGSRPGARLEVERISDAARLPALGAAWEALAAAYPEATVFLSPHYARAWLHAFGSEVALWLLVVRRGEEPVALFPLALSTWRAYGMPLRQLTFLRNRHVLRADALMAEESAAAARAVLGYLAEHAAEWDLLYLHDVPDTSPLVCAVPEAAAAAGLSCDAWTKGRSHRFLPIGGEWADYLASRSANFRWQAKKFRKRLQSLGKVEVRCIADRDGLGAALEDVFSLEQRSWQGRHGDSALSGADRVFCRALVAHAPGDRLGEIWQLEVDGRPVSSLHLLCDGRRLYLFTSYYDEAFAAAGPGFVLMNEMLERTWRRPYDAFDFNGDTPAFARFTGLARQHYCTRVYAPRLKGQLARVSREVLARLRRGAPA
jgi:CelD/BcsL family acetyltransferase involved in cellulose biosynthesis